MATRKTVTSIAGLAGILILATVAISVMSRPAPSQTPPGDSKAAKPVLEGYRVEADQLESLAENLRKHFSARSEIRIVPQRRTSQILILAPEDVHREIPGLLDRLQQTAATPAAEPGQDTQVVPIRFADRAKVQRAIAVLQASEASRADAARAAPRGTVRWGGDLVAMLFQNADDAAAGDDAADPDKEDEPAPAEPADDVAADDAATGDAPAGDAPAAGGLDDRGDLIEPVQIEFLEGLDVIVVRGRRRDVERVVKIINEIERLSAVTEPVIEIYRLRHVDCEPLSELVIGLYDQVFAPRHGPMSITPLVKPNALLLIGRGEAVTAFSDLLKRLDEPVQPSTQFRVFQLQHMPAEDAEATINDFFAERAGLGTRLRVIADYRSNALIVRASPRDMAELTTLLTKIDVADSAATDELRVFRLRNSLAEELAPVLQDAITGQGSPTGGRTGAAARPGTGAAGTSSRATQLRSAMLTFMTVDPAGGRSMKSGILTNVRVTADTRANALLVTGPAQSMDLIAALIDQLDALPTAEAQIKVFTIVNGDAVSLSEMLQTLFSEQTGQQGQPAVQTGAAAGDSSLVPLRFSVDERTNSIIASGSSGDLAVVEAILLRLDESDVRLRKSVVYRLRNAPATDVSNAINEFLRSERQVQQIVPQAISPFQQIEREVIVVPEPVSNSLIVSATPRFFDEIAKLVEDLDARPPMVLIQVLIAEVALDNTNEVGVELGLQDSLLFDRGVVTDVVTPGFAFINQALGNSSDAASLGTRTSIGRQSYSSFAVGRTNQDLAYGGLVLSAGSESVNVLIRALQDNRRLDVLSRPQVMTLDNQSAFVQVGERVPRVTSSQITTTGTVNNTVLENVGLLLGVTPRISPDGLVVMEIDAEKSQLGEVEDGIPISVNAAGAPVLSPIIDIVTAQTTVSARSGQTVVLGGLISKRDVSIRRQVPGLGSIPVLGELFRYDTVEETRAELLIVMTPFIIREEADLDRIRQMESERMSWCLADVVNVHNEGVLEGTLSEWSEAWDDAPAEVVYPDDDPTGTGGTPTPAEREPAMPLRAPNPPAPTDQSILTRPRRSVASDDARPLPTPGRNAQRSEVRFRAKPAVYDRPNDAGPMRPPELPKASGEMGTVAPARYQVMEPYDAGRPVRLPPISP